MKEKVMKALLWSVSIMIGLSIVYLIKGTQIDVVRVMIYGIVAGIVDFIFEAVSKRNSKKKS